MKCDSSKKSMKGQDARGKNGEMQTMKTMQAAVYPCMCLVPSCHLIKANNHENVKQKLPMLM